MNSICIIMPAHNEAMVIGRSLASLLKNACPGELRIYVVANGCTDDTAEQARAFGASVTVIETDVPSKSNALNLGDRAATCFPRFYVDADVRIGAESLRQIADALASDRVLAAAPRPQLDLSGSSWPVRAYYGIDMQLPWFREGIGNSGVYAVSAEGHARFGAFPDITTDDSFVRLHFQPHERVTVKDAVSIVTAPATLRALIAIKTRSHFSKWEINAHCPELVSNEGESNRKTLLRFCLRPSYWPGLAVYAYVKIVARLRCRLKYRVGRASQWERDNTSRAAAPAPVSCDLTGGEL